MNELCSIRTAIVVLATIATFALTGCNTLEGIGKDVKKAGEKVEQAAKKK